MASSRVTARRTVKDKHHPIKLKGIGPDVGLTQKEAEELHRELGEAIRIPKRRRQDRGVN